MPSWSVTGPPDECPTLYPHAASSPPGPPPVHEHPQTPPVKLQKTVSFTTSPDGMIPSRPSPSGIAPGELLENNDERTAIASSLGARSVRSYSGAESFFASTPSSGQISPVHTFTHEPVPHEAHRNGDVKESLGFFGKLGAIELENKGSVARDHLALERTFLAWLRTSLAFASIGIAVTQLFRLNSVVQPEDSKPSAETLQNIGKPLGATFLAIAIFVLLAGTNRYYESQAWLLQGKFPASRGSVFLMTFIASALIVTSLVIVLTVSPGIIES